MDPLLISLKRDVDSLYTEVARAAEHAIGNVYGMMKYQRLLQQWKMRLQTISITLRQVNRLSLDVSEEELYESIIDKISDIQDYI